MSWTVENLENTSILTMTSGKANAMNPEFFEEMLERLKELEAAGPRPLVLTAPGKIFCAGLDLVRLSAMDRPQLESFFDLMDRALLKLFHYPAPTVAAVNGHAIAGGAVLALACDSRVAARGNGKFGLREVAVGVSFPSVAFELVRAAVPRRHERDVILFAALLGPDEALRHGLADEVVEPDDLTGAAVAEPPAGSARAPFVRRGAELQSTAASQKKTHSVVAPVVEGLPPSPVRTRPNPDYTVQTLHRRELLTCGTSRTSASCRYDVPFLRGLALGSSRLRIQRRGWRVQSFLCLGLQGSLAGC